jgi:hypothetical protein
MAKYYVKSFIRSKIGSKIVIFVFILIILVITNFVIVSYYQSQMTYLGNSINIAGKNPFLTSNLMMHVSEYLLTEDNTKSSSTVNSAINQLESNILTLRQGGNIVAGIDLKPLPREFLDDWNKIYQKWISIKTNLANKIIKSTNELTKFETSIDRVREVSLLETEAISLIDSSNLLVTQLGNYLKGNSEYSLFIQQIFQSDCLTFNGFPDGGRLDHNLIQSTNIYHICFKYEDEQGNDCSTLTLATGEEKTCTVKNYMRFATLGAPRS